MNPLTRLLDSALGIRTPAENTDTGTIENAAKSAPVPVLPGPDPATLTIGSRAPREPLSPEAQAELKVTHRGTQPVEDPLAHVPHPSEEQRRIFLAYAAKQGWKAPAKASADLQELDQPWLNLVKALVDYSDTAAKAAFFDGKISMAKRIAAGDNTAKSADTWTQEDFLTDYQVRRKAIKLERKNVEGQARQIAQPVLSSFAEHLNSLADKLEVPLRAQAESFGCKYYPPNFVLLMRKEAQLCAEGRRHTSGRPSTMLTLLETNL